MEDPTELLARIREIVQEIEEEGEDLFDLADELVNRFTQLDDYLTHGGELPEDWEH